jgi:hypothetical protein
VRFLRWLASPLTSIVTAVGLVWAGAPTDAIGTGATSAGQFVQNMLSPDKRRAQEPASAHLLVQRAQALDEFGRSVTLAWHAAGTLMTVRPTITNFVPVLLLHVRCQRQFQNSMAKAAASLSSVLLFASGDTQDAALDLFSELGNQLGQLARTDKPGARGAASQLEAGSDKLGEKVTAWRAAARRELATGEAG